MTLSEKEFYHSLFFVNRVVWVELYYSDTTTSRQKQIIRKANKEWKGDKIKLLRKILSMEKELGYH